MPVYVVRHAKAGSRSTWRGDDEARPLSRAGAAQAMALASWLAGFPVSRIVSSPYVRCVQTVEPLAGKLGLGLEATAILAEGSPVDGVLELLEAVPDHSVLCSHGDVILAAVEALVGRGLVVEGEPDWRKGATWLLQRAGTGTSWATGQVVPPPC